MPRPALVDLVAGGLLARLVVIVAAAGYGKTTLLGQAADQVDAPVVWCALEDPTASAYLLLAVIAAGLGQRFPGFGANLQLVGPLPLQVEALSQEIGATVPDDVVVMVDDAHHLHGEDAAVLAMLVDRLPPNVHLAVASRERLPLPLSRLRLDGEALELGEADLTLTRDEATELLRRANVPVDATRGAALYAASEGWAAGLLMLAEAGGAGRGSARGSAAEYLAEEVFARQPAHIRRFLLATAVPSRFDRRSVRFLAAGDDPDEALDEVLARHLFVIPMGGERETFRYHSLFRAFLETRLAGLPREELAALHGRAGDACLAEGDAVEAVAHYLEAGRADVAASVLDETAEQLAISPVAPSLATLLARIPEHERLARPGLLLAEAQLLSGAGRFREAVASLRRALEELTDAGEYERASVAALSLIQTVGISGGDRDGQLSAAIAAQLARIPPATPALPGAHVMAAALHAYANRYDDAEAALARAEELLDAHPGPMSVYVAPFRAFWLDYPRGHLIGAAEALRASLAALAGGRHADPLGQRPFVRTWRVLLLNDLGRAEEALDDARRISADADDLGLAGLAAGFVAWAQMQTLTALERWDLLEQAIGAARPVFESGAAPGQRHYLEAALGAVAAARGDTEGARHHLGLAADLVKANGCHVETATRLTELARSARRAGDAALARAMLDEAVAAASVLPAPWALADALILRTTVAADDDDLERALSLTAREGHDDLWLRVHRRDAGAILGRALGMPAVAPSAERLLAALGPDAVRDALHAGPADAPEARRRLAALAARVPDAPPDVLDDLASDDDAEVRRLARHARLAIMARPRPPVELRTFGGLSVRLAGVPVMSGPLMRPKVRALLARLIAADGRPVHREEIADALWPELPLQRARRTLHTTVGELRRAISGSAHERDEVVRTVGETYHLALSADDEWDGRRLRELLRRSGQPPLEVLLEAEALYTCPFLPEWPYEPWAASLRDELEVAVDEVLARLATALQADGRHGEAIERRRRLVARQPEDETRHRELMHAYAAAGSSALALRQFHACRTLLRHRLAIEPSRETRDLYLSLL